MHLRTFFKANLKGVFSFLRHSGSGHLIIYCACWYQCCTETCYLHQQCGTELRWASGWLYRSQRNNLNTEDRTDNKRRQHSHWLNSGWRRALCQDVRKEHLQSRFKFTKSLAGSLNQEWQRNTCSLVSSLLNPLQGHWTKSDEGTLAVSFQGYWIPCRVIEPRVTKEHLQSRFKVTESLTGSLNQEWRSSFHRATEVVWQSPFTKLEKQSDKRPSTKLQKQSDKGPVTKLQK